MLGNFAILLLYADSFSQWMLFFLENILSGILSEYLRVLIKIRPDVSTGLIWIQTVCNRYKQTTLASKELNHIVCWVMYIVAVHSTGVQCVKTKCEIF